MKKAITTLAIAGFALPLAVACASDGSSGGASTSAANGQTSAAPPSGGAGSSTASAGGTTAATGGTTAATGTGANTGARTGASGSGAQIPSLVNVDLRNVLNDLAMKLDVDRANVPLNIQLPVQVAANVCGVSTTVLAASTGGQANCTARSAPQELTQAVQQQMATGGSVGGGAQSSTTATGRAPRSSGAATGAASNTSATSPGATDSTTTPPK
jgi:hypothetical protein